MQSHKKLVNRLQYFLLHVYIVKIYTFMYTSQVLYDDATNKVLAEATKSLSFVLSVHLASVPICE
jgi:hypothetical protein